MSGGLSPHDIPGAILPYNSFEVATVPELKRWLKCRNAATSGRKRDLVDRCKTYAADPERANRIVNPDSTICSQQETSSEHASSTHCWSQSLTGLPVHFGEGKIYNHLGGKTEKHRIAGYTMFKCGKDENVLVRSMVEDNLFEVKGMVSASYSRDRYYVTVGLSNSGNVVKGKCLCKAGATGRCKHIGALLFQLNEYRLMSKTEIPAQIACTEEPRKWNVKKAKPPSISKTFDNLAFVKYAPGKGQRSITNTKRRQEYSSLPPSKLDLPNSRLDDLAAALTSHRCMWAEIVKESIHEPTITSSSSSTCMSQSNTSTEPVPRENVGNDEPPNNAAKKPLSCLIDTYQSMPEMSETTTSTELEPSWEVLPGLSELKLTDEEPPHVYGPAKGPNTEAPSDCPTVLPTSQFEVLTEQDLMWDVLPGLSELNLTEDNPSQSQDIEDLESPTFLQRCEEYMAAQYPLPECDISQIEHETRGQVSNKQWFQHRCGRITASMVGEIVHRRPQTPPDALVERIFKYTHRSVNPPACQHGLDFEAEAREKYKEDCLKKGVKVTVEETGLVIDKQRFWFAASPDGLVHVESTPTDSGLIEVKCPYVGNKEHEDIPCNIHELTCSRKYFYLTLDGDVNRKHNYFFQIQAQMGITEMKWCDFVVYYKVPDTNICDLHTVRVNFEQDIFNLIIKKVDGFYLRGVVPELLTKRVQAGEKLYPNSKVYRYSKRKQ